MISAIPPLSETEQAHKGTVSTKGGKYESWENQLPQGQRSPPARRQCGRARMNSSLFSHGGSAMYADTRLESTVHFLPAKSYLGLTNPERESLISWVKTLRPGPSHCTG